MTLPITMGQKTRAALRVDVRAAIGRGWTLEQIRTWFASQGIAAGAGAAGLQGQAVDPASYHNLVRVSIVGIPAAPEGGAE